MSAAANFWSANKDLLALLVSLIALTISTYLSLRNLATTKGVAVQSILTTREIAAQNLAATQEIAENTSRHNRTLAMNATYQRMHELLVDPKAAAGRRALFLAARTGDFPSLGAPGWDEINYSLALYDTLGGYVDRNQVDEQIVLDAWHHPLVNITEPVQRFISHRKAQGIDQPWAHLINLLRRAQIHECRCPKDVERPGA